MSTTLVFSSLNDINVMRKYKQDIKTNLDVQCGITVAIDDKVMMQFNLKLTETSTDRKET